MSDYVFLFDLDSTITKQEILPTIAEHIGIGERMRELTEQAMLEDIPFRTSFLSRVSLLKDVSVSQMAREIADIPLNEEMVKFIRDNRQRCFIATGNLDVWIWDLMEQMGMLDSLYSSKGIVQNDRLVGVASIIDKQLLAQQMAAPFVAIGDGSNDAPMVSAAEVGIGYGGVRPIAPSLLEVCDHAVSDEAQLCQLLEDLL